MSVTKQYLKLQRKLQNISVKITNTVRANDVITLQM